MDPNEALKNARRACKRLLDGTAGNNAEEIADVETLVNAFDALDGWLGKGGFLPDAWAR